MTMRFKMLASAALLFVLLSGGPSLGQSSSNGWGSVTRSTLSDNRAGLGLRGDRQSFAVGGDRRFGQALAGGFATYGVTRLEGPDSTYRSDGWSGGLYGRLNLAGAASLTGAIGYGTQDVRLDSTLAGVRSLGATDRDQAFASLGVDGQYRLTQRLVAVPAAALTFTKSSADAYLDQAGRSVAGGDSRVALAQFGATAYYDAGEVTPYLGASLNQQLNSSMYDKTYAVIGAGVTAPIGPVNIVVGITTLLGKTSEHETSYSLALSKPF